jgi:hypothetical protein
LVRVVGPSPPSFSAQKLKPRHQKQIEKNMTQAFIQLPIRLSSRRLFLSFWLLVLVIGWAAFKKVL